MDEVKPPYVRRKMGLPDPIIKIIRNIIGIIYIILTILLLGFLFLYTIIGLGNLFGAIGAVYLEYNEGGMSISRVIGIFILPAILVFYLLREKRKDL